MDRATARRHDNVRLLLRTLHDIYPGPQAVRSSALSGPAESSRVPCTFCHRSGKAFSPALKRVTACPVCDGHKWRKRRAGEPAWDEMTGQPIATVEARKPEPMSPQRLEAELARIEHTLRLHDGDFDPDEKETWEAAREKRDAEASYPELERVLDVMQIQWPLARSFVTARYFSGMRERVSVAELNADDIVVAWISDRMRGPVRIPKHFYDQQQEELKAECRELLRHGVSEREIMSELAVGKRFIRTVAAGILQVSSGPPPSPVSAREA